VAFPFVEGSRMMCYLAAQLLIQNDSDLPQGLAGHPEGRLSVSIGPSVTDGHSSRRKAHVRHQTA